MGCGLCRKWLRADLMRDRTITATLKDDSKRSAKVLAFPARTAVPALMAA